jgi:NAD-dependent deacetylase
LHGELKKARPVNDESSIIEWDNDLNIGDTDGQGNQLRPYIVWFGEMVPAMEAAEEIVKTAELFLIVGTSMQVYPAAGLIHEVPENCEVFVIDPHLENRYVKGENFFAESATEGMKKLRDRLK